MSEEKRRILDMVEQGTITQEDAARLLEALGENEPAPAQPQESQPPQDGTWEAEHQGDEDCQGPNQRVEIHLEGEGAKPIYQEITAALDEAAPVFENLGKIVEDAVTSATQAVDAAWPQVKEAVSSATEKAKGVAQSAAQAARESVLVGAVVPGKAALTPLPLEENAYQAPAGGPVTRLRVEWVNGPVEIRPWEGNTIRVAEYAARPLKDSERMELQENGGKLRIRWSRDKAFRSRMFLQKHLVVELPQDAALEELRVDTVSGGAYLSGFQAEECRVSTVSGAARCQGLRAQRLRVEAVSGAASLENVAAEELRCTTTSGKLELCGFAAPAPAGGDGLRGPYRRGQRGGALPEHCLGAAFPPGGAASPPGEAEHRLGPHLRRLAGGRAGLHRGVQLHVRGVLQPVPPVRGAGQAQGAGAVYGSGGASLRLDTVSGAMELHVAPPQE